MELLFISAAHNMKGRSDSGGNACNGIAESLYCLLGDHVSFISHPSIQSFPHGRLYIPSYKECLDNGATISFLPTLNLKIIKSWLWGLSIRKMIRRWVNKHKKEDCYVMVYNTYHPPISAIYKVCRKVKVASISAVLFDLGVPPKRLGLSTLSMIGYHFAEKSALKYIPLLDGRVIINESIITHYAPEKSFVLIDGGINKSVISHLFPLSIKNDPIYVFVCAGMLWDQNGTRLLLAAIKHLHTPNIRVVFAGTGIDVPLIKKEEERDPRIMYVGQLDMDSLFRLYQNADVLLNLRIQEQVDFHFPGKLLEYLSTGRYVVSTPIAHAEREYGSFMSVLHDITPFGLAKEMERITLMSKKELFQLGEKARQYMLDNKTWEKQTIRILEYLSNQ